MKINTLKSAVIGALMVPLTAIHAEEAAPAEESGFSVSGNVGLYSDYIFRGYTQTQNNPAVQGGFDVEHSSGFYIGTWASNVEWTTVGNSSAMVENSVEIDVYGGFAGSFGDTGFGYDIGVLQFWYPGDQRANASDADATEVYLGLSYSHDLFSVSLTNYMVVSDEAWGFADMDGETYTDLTVDIPFGQATLSGHVGHQTFGSGAGTNLDYTDWKVNLDYALNDTYSVGAFYTDTDMTDSSWTFGTVKVGDAVGGAYLSASF